MNSASHRLLAALLGLALPLAAQAGGRAECLELPSQILHHAVRYCVLLPPSYEAETTRRYPVLYYLHGLGDDEQSLVSFGGMYLVEDLREQGQLGEFLIATPDGGTSFYINSHDGRQRYEDFLIREFFPWIERHYRVRAGRAHRGITGVSMGGYGALRLAFRYPQLFGAASAHSAALIEKLPEVQTPRAAPSSAMRILGSVFGLPPDPEFWERNSPFTFAKENKLAGLKIYFDCGTEDQYGFDAGARALDDLLKSRNVPHEFHLYPGGHGWSYLAEHISTSLEFHSRAFGLSPNARGKLRKKVDRAH